jgi:hypothetical protein
LDAELQKARNRDARDSQALGRRRTPPSNYGNCDACESQNGAQAMIIMHRGIFLRPLNTHRCFCATLIIAAADFEEAGELARVSARVPGAVARTGLVAPAGIVPRFLLVKQVDGRF